MNILLLLKLIITLFFLSFLPAQVHALTPEQVFDRVKDSIVVVKTLDTKGKVKGQGSGVLLPSGQIATNCHVVEGGASYQVTQGEKVIPATLYAEDWDKDICLVDAKGFQGKPVQLGTAASLKVGVAVYAVGAPKGLELSLSNGIVAQLRGGPPPLIQTTAAISPGSSGGGLFDEEGRLVGLTTLYMKDGQSLNFAMPVEWISEIKPGRKAVAQGGSEIEWFKRIIALEKSKDWKKMIDWCQKWIKTEPKNTAPWYGLGTAFSNLNRHNEAIEAYRQVVSLNPKDAIAWNAIGSVCWDLKRYSDAVDAFRQALKINPDDADAWCNLGIAYNKFERYSDAVDSFRQALKINPENADAWKKLGFAYVNLERYTDTIDAYQQALKINPNDPRTWYLLGVTYILDGNKLAAMDVIKKLRPLDPERADKLFNMTVPR